MSLYNMVFGSNPDSNKLLTLLDKTQGDFGRYRDVYVEDGYIVVHTRCGGGNRDDYQEVFEEMSEHPWYSHDQDGDFDNTYADIYFKIPEDKLKTYVSLLDQGSNPQEAWKAFVDNVKEK